MSRYFRSFNPVVLTVLGGLLLNPFVRADDPNPERFAKAIDWFAANDQKTATPREPVLFVGSASIVHWQTAAAFEAFPVVNRGFGGAHLADVLHYFDRVVTPYDPQVIVLCCGEEDIAEGQTPEQVLSDFAAFRKRVKERLGLRHVIYLPIKPCPARWEQWPAMQTVNDAIKKQAQSTPSLIYAETAAVLLGPNGEPDAALFRDDGLQLNSAGYAKWHALLAPLLAQHVQRDDQRDARSSNTRSPASNKPERLRIGRMTERSMELRFLSYVPPGYTRESKERWPLVLYLHGSGERGKDISKVLRNGPPKLIKMGRQFPFIMIAPQCPGGRWWRVGELVALLEQIQANYLVDPARIYVTGLSMGGFGTFQLAAAIPHRLAAVAPICGGGIVETAPLFKDLPLWAFHGGADRSVPVQRSREMVEAINAAGGNAKLTIYPGVGHNSWTRTYADPKFWEWLMAQKRE